MNLRSNHAAYYNDKWTEAYEHNRVPLDDERSGVILRMVDRWVRDRESCRGVRIIDVGCGVGWLAGRLASLGSVTGIDSSDAAIEIARSTVAGCEFECLDFFDDRLSDLGRFDVAVCSEVIEHVPDPLKTAFAARLASLVRPGGLLAITTPNRAAWGPYWRQPDSLEWKQPVEDWCTKRSLLGLLSADFACSFMTTYNFGFSKQGIYRAINSVKLNRLARLAGLGRGFERFKANKYGLYIAGEFVKK